MIKINCSHTTYTKHGKSKHGAQRFKCKTCGTRFTEQKTNDGPLGSMRVDVDKAMMVIGMLLEGMSIRAASRLTGMDKDTIDRLILEVGERFQNFSDKHLVNIPVEHVQCDELWSIVGMKAKQAKHQDDATMGDSWTYVALSEKKLVVAHYVGARSKEDTNYFLSLVRRAVDTTQRFQVSTDGWAGYRYGVPFALGSKVQFGMLIKHYQSTQEVTRYSPAQIIKAERRPIFGSPDPKMICTSHVESFNQKMRMHLKRFTRLTNAHSKSLKHHVAMQQIFFAFHNFVRPHLSLDKRTPAMASGITDRPLKLVELLDGN